MASWAPRNGSRPPPQHQRQQQRQDLVSRIHNDALPTALAGHLEISDSNVQSDSSSSESDFQSPNHPGDLRPRHARSMSNPFPSLFSGKKKRHDAAARAPPDPGLDGDQGSTTGQGARKHRRAGPAGSKDFATGQCMACASLVKWPRELKVFKCTICSTINDLAPPEGGGRKSRPSSRRRDASQDSASRQPRGQPISVQLSRRLVRQCLHSYVSRTLCTRSRSNSETPPGPPARPSYGGHLLPASVAGRASERSAWGQDGRRPSNGQATYDPTLVFDEEPTLHPNPLRRSSHMSRSYSSSYPERPSLQPATSSETPRGARRRVPSPSRTDEAKRIFRPLVDYIVSCFSSFDSVNSSFMTQSSRQPVRQGGEFAIRRKPVPPREAPMIRQPTEFAREVPRVDDVVSELDPKMLLLGDFAENGMWWTGGQNGAVQQASAPSSARVADAAGKASTSAKSPHLNWQELGDWYSLVINAAEGWLGVYEDVSRDPNFVQPAEEDLRALEQDLLQAQAHVQRVLLKATELLLKRPGRPLTAPVDLRFLLIVLENPLLHSHMRPFSGLMQSEAPSTWASPPGKSATPKSGPLSGQHSGIIKRIIGLMSNSSTECHSQLISWFARYHTTRFVRTKDLVSGFLTYRLLRQSDSRRRPVHVDITAGLIPEMQAGRSVGAYLYQEIGSGSKRLKDAEKTTAYTEDWQVKASARVLALLFAANNLPNMRHGDEVLPNSNEAQVAAGRDGVHGSGQLLPTSDFYNLLIDNVDLVGDFESWESRRTKFAFCQYPFLLSIWAKTKILEYDARRQMQNKARDAFFDSIMTRRNIKQYLTLDVRRDCLVDDSLKAVSEVIGSGSEDVKKALRITFRGEEGIDGGGLRKEWFLLLAREVFNPDHGMFLYDEDSRYCYFNPNSFETSDQFFLVGVVMGLAIYNSTILDVALPPFAFRKLLASAPARGQGPSAHPKPSMKYTLDDLAEYRPRLARGLRQLLDHDGDVEQTFCLDFVIGMDRYGTTVQVPLCHGGERKPVTNNNRREYVDLYVRYVLDAAVARQFEPFKRGFYTVCGGNAFSLFRPEEIELLVRGSDAALDIVALRAVAEYDNWDSRQPDGAEPVVGWFWETFEDATPADQRKMLLFITGSDRIPAMGAAMLPIKISCLGDDCGRFPIARTCFNLLSLWRYGSKERLDTMLWRAVRESEGFGLK